jgi:hypothetical protein
MSDLTPIPEEQAWMAMFDRVTAPAGVWPPPATGAAPARRRPVWRLRRRWVITRPLAAAVGLALAVGCVGAIVTGHRLGGDGSRSLGSGAAAARSSDTPCPVGPGGFPGPGYCGLVYGPSPAPTPVPPGEFPTSFSDVMVAEFQAPTECAGGLGYYVPYKGGGSGELGPAPEGTRPLFVGYVERSPAGCRNNPYQPIGTQGTQGTYVIHVDNCVTRTGATVTVRLAGGVETDSRAAAPFGEAAAHFPGC